MNAILRYIREYWNITNKWYLLAVTLFTAILIFFNYKFNIEHSFANLTDIQCWLAFTALYTLSYGFPFLLYQFMHHGGIESSNKLLSLKLYTIVFACACLFSFKASSTVILEQLRLVFTNTQGNFWAIIFNTPVKLVIIWGGMHLLWQILQPSGAYLGLRLPLKKDARSYFYLFLIMVPLVTIAASLPSFLAHYPKFKSVIQPGDAAAWWKILLYELSYASDFITIELFFRGLLVAGMVKIAGPMVIIPMAAFYCSIHFGKPLGECISSYFGGLFLGILTWRSNSIAGGLFIHIGIAWLMELAVIFY